jgi:two-component system sensor histidine kinase DesK
LAALGAQALVTFIPFIALGQMWFVVPGLLVALMVPFIRGGRARAWFVIIVVIIVAVSSSLGSHRLSETAWLVCAALGAGLVLSGVLQLILAIAQLRARRDEQVNSVIIRERMRFSRDLHDLLGYRLSAITLKAELAKRKVTDCPSLAKDEIIDVISTARQALAEVRTAAHGYRNVSLAKEASAAALLLEDAGIQTHIELAYGVLTEDADSVLAVVLREAVTNVLRHSAARNCSITVKQVDGDWIRLQVTNDGVSSVARQSIRGDGHDNMASRLEEIGGGLIARSTGSSGSTPDRFQVTVLIPGGLSLDASEVTD